MTVLRRPMCMSCRHWNEDDFTCFSCKAFPEGIPEPIIRSEVLHIEPYPGDNGIRFEPVDKEQQ